MEFEIVPIDKAEGLRKSFVQKFMDAASDHYKKHILTLIQDQDDIFCDGYLWECLQDNENYEKECSMEVAAEFLKGKKNVFFMWDFFSKKRLSGKRFFRNIPKPPL